MSTNLRMKFLYPLFSDHDSSEKPSPHTHTPTIFQLKKKKMIIKFYLNTLAIFLSTIPCGAQIYIDSTNNVGVGINDFTKAKIYVENLAERSSLRVFNKNATDVSKHGIYSNTSSAGVSTKYGILNYTYQGSNEESYGIYSYSHNSGNDKHYGIYNQLATGGTGKKYGLYNDIISTTGDQLFGIYNFTQPQGTGSNYGVYSKVLPSSSHTGVKYGFHTFIKNLGTGMSYGVSSNIDGGSGYAGFFMGDVYISGTLFNPSDDRLKENVRDLRGALEVVSRIQPKQYRYSESAKLGLKSGREQYGFLAQEMEAVLPSVVMDVQYPEYPEAIADSNPEVVNEKGDPHPRGQPEDVYAAGETYKAIDYISLIAVLTQAIKEQQVRIETLEEEVAKLKN